MSVSLSTPHTSLLRASPVAAVLRTRAEARMVPVGGHAHAGVRRQVVPQPPLLRRSGAHVDVAVERDHVPRPDLVAVVPAPRGSRERAIIMKVGRPVVAPVIVVPGGGSSPRPVPSPAPRVAAPKLLRRSIAVRVVAGCEHGA